jgi:hypothetical protein
MKGHVALFFVLDKYSNVDVLISQTCNIVFVVHRYIEQEMEYYVNANINMWYHSSEWFFIIMSMIISYTSQCIALIYCWSLSNNLHSSPPVINWQSNPRSHEYSLVVVKHCALWLVQNHCFTANQDSFQNENNKFLGNTVDKKIWTCRDYPWVIDDGCYIV